MGRVAWGRTPFLASAGALLALVAAAHLPAGASGLPSTLPVDLAAGANVVIRDRLPATVQSYDAAGDVNGDGLADVALGLGYGRFRGSNFVLLGRRTNASLSLPLPRGAGFEITSDHQVLGPPSGAGDVNRDGLMDVIQGAVPRRGARHRPGSAYVVFGKRDNTPVDLDDLGSGGFRIAGRERGSFTGYAVSGAGDVNGDGKSDLIVSAPGFWRVFRTAYVVFGKAASATVRLGSLGRRGFAIRGQRHALVGQAVTGVGDMNGDGLSDVALDVNPRALHSFDRYSQYVVFGKRSTSPVSLARLAGRGVHIATSRWLDSFDVLDAAGDVNGDGLADLLIGVPDVSLHDGTYGFVVFGSKALASLKLASLGSRGLRIVGEGEDAESALGAVGDLNGDGRDDVAAFPPPAVEGPAFVVFGRPQGGAADVRSLGSGGVQLVSGGRRPVTGAGDFNGDGRLDVIVSRDPLNAPQETLVIFG
jgi:hypothetical protein